MCIRLVIHNHSLYEQVSVTQSPGAVAGVAWLIFNTINNRPKHAYDINYPSSMVPARPRFRSLGTDFSCYKFSSSFDYSRQFIVHTMQHRDHDHHPSVNESRQQVSERLSEWVLK